MESGLVLSVLTVVLIILASTDLWRLYTIKSMSSMFELYKRAVLYSDDFWTLGFRIENLEMKLEKSSERVKQIQRVLDSLLPKVKLDKELFEDKHARLWAHSRIAHCYA